MIQRQMQGHIAMLAFSALIAGSFALGARVANDISPIALNAVRFWTATMIVGALAWSISGLRRENFQAPWRYVVLGAVFSLYFVLMFEGLKTAQPVSAAAVFTLTPILSAGFGYLLLRQLLTRRMAFAITVGGIGALWVIFQADFQAFLAFDIGRGEAIYFVGVVAHALYTPLVRKLNRGESVWVFAFGTFLAGSVVMTVFGWNDLRATEWSTLRPLVWMTLLYIAVFASAVTLLLLQFATMNLPSAKVMAYTYLTPSWVMLWDVALGGQLPPVAIFVGIGLTTVALLLLLRDDGG